MGPRRSMDAYVPRPVSARHTGRARRSRRHSRSTPSRAFHAVSSQSVARLSWSLAAGAVLSTHCRHALFAASRLRRPRPSRCLTMARATGPYSLARMRSMVSCCWVFWAAERPSALDIAPAHTREAGTWFKPSTHVKHLRGGLITPLAARMSSVPADACLAVCPAPPTRARHSPQRLNLQQLSSKDIVDGGRNAVAEPVCEEQERAWLL